MKTILIQVTSKIPLFSSSHYSLLPIFLIFSDPATEKVDVNLLKESISVFREPLQYEISASLSSLKPSMEQKFGKLYAVSKKRKDRLNE